MEDQNNTVVSFFDEPAIAMPDAPFGDLWDADDDSRELSLRMSSYAPADEIRMSDAVGQQEYENALTVGGDEAAAGFAADWNWRMTPSMRARVLSDRAFDAAMGSLMDEATDAAVQPPVDPLSHARDIIAARADRHRS